ncbi:protease complex subunit PrcB family protein [Caldisalinibacter kiritimatiensis]|uniref:PrcB C-terminal domain-containing protein n=1 Tax=Caldisalinibacter kiritimatiensis TaxID=1304284 RepID=R1AWD3_9FIRM|nr:protease complex subunit PrcB family protein [Caldisalinibacter kiritimatiensis]EOD00932.1 hypothetical protein L21TH_1040 [Caldisalinibacter kiritimatiensis]
MKKFSILVFVLILVIGISAGCAFNSQNEKITGELEFETVDISTIENEDVLMWYQTHSKEEGVFYHDTEDSKFILLAAGEKPTGGYSVEITSVKATNEKIIVNGNLNSPKENEMVTQALTYPSQVIKIQRDERPVVLGEFNNQSQINKKRADVYEEKGIFIGFIDNNSVEIEIKGLPKAFRLSEQIKQQLQKNEPKSGQKVQFLYIKNQNEQMEITEITWNQNKEIGTYIGQIDDNSIEMKVNDKTNAYRLSEDVKENINKLATGDKVQFTYKENENGQLIILDIKKLSE